MKPRTQVLCLGLMLVGTALTSGTPPRTAPDLRRERAADSYGKLPLSFEANTGQTDPAVKFLSRGNGYALFLTGNEAVLALSRRHEAAVGQTDLLHMQLVGAQPSQTVAGLQELPGTSNYFIGNDPRRWRTNVPNYKKVRFEGVYPGVDLEYYGNQRQLEYDFIVAPGADPSQITLGFSGAGRLEIDADGELALHTRTGQVRWRKPTVYQEIGGVRHVVDGRYVRKGAHAVSFDVASFDRHHPLVIDPILVYSTFLGGTGDDTANAIAVDAFGSAYVVGTTYSTDFPTANAAQSSAANSSRTAFVSKLNVQGTALVYSTYLGGSCADEGNAIAVLGIHAFVTGFTCSSNFPTTPGAFQTSGTNAFQVFVTRLSASGGLDYSTYVGGGIGHGVAVDESGNAYVTGIASATDFPTTPSAFQSSLGTNLPGAGGAGDAFVTKLNADGSALLYSTYLGGSGNDTGWDIAVDDAGHAYVTGVAGFFSSSSGIPFPSVNALPSAPASGAFVAKFDINSSGPDSLVYSTVLGGAITSNGNGTSIAVDSVGDVYVAGTTLTAFPTTAGAFQTTFIFCGGCWKAWVAKISNASGAASLVYSTYLGGSRDTVAHGIAVDDLHNAYITGYTLSGDFPTVDAIQPALAGAPFGDAFVTKLNATGSALVYSTFLGGASSPLFDDGRGIALDVLNNAYVAGTTSSTDFPVVTPVQSAGGGADAFVSKIGPGGVPPPPGLLFLASASPKGLELGASSTKAIQVTLESLNGISDTVQLSAAGIAPADATLTFSSSSVTVPATGKVTTTLSVATTASASAGDSTVTITATGPTGIPKIVKVTVTISASSPPPPPPPPPGPCCTGDYVDPVEGVSVSVNHDAESPSGKYAVSTAAGPPGLANITIKRGSTQMLTAQAAFWGFSPDDDRFVTHWVQDPGGASIHHVTLYNLAGATPQNPIWTSADSTQSVRIQFSPSGRYLFYTDVLSGRAHLTLVDTTTGTVEFMDSFPALVGAPIADQDTFGTIGLGFGPDDSRFVYAYVSVQTPQTAVQWNLVNLQKGPGHALVKSLTLVGETAASWQFNPCGAVIALVHQPGQQGVQIEIYNTKDGTSAGSGAQISNPIQALALRTTATSQVAKNAGIDHTLGANNAACTTTPPPPPPPSACCTGNYVDPDEGLNVSISKAGRSPSGTYTVTSVPGSGGLADITVKRGSTQILTTQAAFWGFSPDDDRFVTHWVQDPGGASIHHVTLYNLAGTTPRTPVWTSSDATQSVRIHFSPSGQYLFYTDVLSGRAQLTLIDATTGVVEFTDSVPALVGAPIPDQDAFGTIGWGFGPDDSRFVYASVSVQTPQTVVQWNLVNLQKGPGHALVKSLTLVSETSAYWQFNPCGEVIALVHQPAQQGAQIEIYNTRDGTSAGSGAQVSSPIQTLVLHTTATSQVATNGGTDHKLGANNAACSSSLTAHSPVNILLVDGQGRRTGFDATAGVVVDEIPGSSFTGPGSEPQTITFPSAAGTYLAFAYGLDSLTSPETYRLTVATARASSDPIDVHDMGGVATKGSVAQFVFVIDDDGVITSFAPLDTTPPVITVNVSGTPGSNGWYTSAVVVSWSVTDAESPIGSSTGCDPTSVTSDTSGATFICTAMSAGGIGSSSITIKRDTSPPTITATAPSGTYLLGQTVTASYSCADGGSGLASCGGTMSSGATVETSTIGPHAITVNAADRAGNSSSLTAGYTVSYRICSLYDANVAKKRGSAYPIRLQLCDAAGNNVSSASIAVHALDVTLVGSATPLAVDDTGNANRDFDFRYDASLGGYIFNLSTAGYASGTYRLNFTVGTDPVVHTAVFAVK